MQHSHCLWFLGWFYFIFYLFLSSNGAWILLLVLYSGVTSSPVTIQERGKPRYPACKACDQPSKLWLLCCLSGNSISVYTYITPNYHCTTSHFILGMYPSPANSPQLSFHSCCITFNILENYNWKTRNDFPSVLPVWQSPGQLRLFLFYKHIALILIE